MEDYQHNITNRNRTGNKVLRKDERFCVKDSDGKIVYVNLPMKEAKMHVAIHQGWTIEKIPMANYVIRSSSLMTNSSVDLRSEVTKRAKEHNISEAEYIRRCIRFAIDNGMP